MSSTFPSPCIFCLLLSLFPISSLLITPAVSSLLHSSHLLFAPLSPLLLHHLLLYCNLCCLFHVTRPAAALICAASHQMLPVSLPGFTLSCSVIVNGTGDMNVWSAAAAFHFSHVGITLLLKKTVYSILSLLYSCWNVFLKQPFQCYWALFQTNNPGSTLVVTETPSPSLIFFLKSFSLQV